MDLESMHNILDKQLEALDAEVDRLRAAAGMPALASRQENLQCEFDPLCIDALFDASLVELMRDVMRGAGHEL